METPGGSLGAAGRPALNTQENGVPGQAETPWQDLAALLSELDQAEQRHPVRPAPAVPPDLSLPDEGQPAPAVLARLRSLMAAVPATTTPAFFNQLFGGRDPMAVVGECVAASLNNALHTRKVAGAAVDLERVLIGKICEVLGFAQGEGSITPGGSLSNLLGLLLARNAAFPEARNQGLSRPGAVYVSAEAHYSLRKAAGILGLGRDTVRAIAVDAEGRMRVDALRAALDQDRAAGLIPVAVVATAGTTVRGAFDPLADLAAVAREYGVWLHVDGAFGGPLILDPAMAPWFAGIALSDSVTWDAHKLMGVPLTCSLLLVRRPGLLQAALDEDAAYLFQETDDHTVEPGRTSLQCGRRNDVLKLWVAWQTHGTRGFQRRFAHLRHLTRYAESRVAADPRLEQVAPAPSLTLCFRVTGVPAATVCAALEQEQRALIGHAPLNGESVIRLVLVNAALTETDLDRLFRHIRDVAERT